MENSLLLGILQSLSPAEQRRLKKWIRSPAHNQRQDGVDLLDYLLEHNRLEKPQLLTKERLFHRLFPDEPYQDAKLRQTLHFLTKTTEAFLVYEELYTAPIQANLLLMRSYRKRGLDKPFRKAYRQTRHLLDDYAYQNDDFLHYQYDLLLEHYIHYEQPKRTKEVKNLQELSDGLDQKFIAEKLRQSCMMQSHQAVVKSSYDSGLQNAVLAFVEERSLWDVPAIGMYYYIFNALNSQESSSWFQKVLEAIDTSGALFPREEMADIYKLSLNYCIRRVNTHPKKFLPLSFDLYQRGLRDQIFLEEGRLSPITFNNIFRSALLLKKLDWAESFVGSYAKYLEPGKRESIVNYSKARLLYEKKRYDEAQEMLVFSNFGDINLQLSAKVLLAKIYYEKDEFDALESLLESLRSFLRRKEILSYHRTIFQNFTRYTRKLVRINPFDQAQRSKLENEIQNVSPIVERDWLLQQVYEL